MSDDFPEAGRKSLPSYAVQSLHQYNLLGVVPAREMGRLGLGGLTKGAFPLHSFSQGTLYLAASLVARAVKSQPSLKEEFGKDVNLNDLVQVGIQRLHVAEALAKERVAYLVKYGVISLDNQQVPVAQVDLVLHDLANAAYGRALEYESGVVALQKEEASGDGTAIMYYDGDNKRRKHRQEETEEPSLRTSEKRGDDRGHTVGRYLHDIRTYKLLTREEEIALGRRVQQGDETAMHDMTNANLRFVVSVARKYRSKMDFFDLVQAGNKGLMGAVAGFDPERGCRFLTYAHPLIRQAVQREVYNRSRTVRLPVHLWERRSKIRCAERKIWQQEKREATLDDLSKTMGMSKKKIRQAIEADTATKYPVSLDQPLDDEHTENLEEIADPNAVSVDDRIMASSVSQAVTAAITKAGLTPRERTVLEERIYHNQTLDNVGNKINLSKERVRNIQKCATFKVRKALFRISSTNDLEALLEYVGLDPALADNDPNEDTSKPTYSTLHQALDQLTPYQNSVIVSLYGLDGKKPESIKQISEEKKKTGRQIHSQHYQSLEKLARLLGKNKDAIRQSLVEMAKNPLNIATMALG